MSNDVLESLLVRKRHGKTSYCLREFSFSASQTVGYYLAVNY